MATEAVELPKDFEAFYRAEYAALVAVAAALTGDQQDAEDLVQDTMVKAFLRWGRVGSLERPGGWCHHVLVNACRSALRRRRTEHRYLRRQRRVEASTLGLPADVMTFWMLVRELPERPRTVVALHFAGEHTMAEVASILGVPEGTVRSDVARARLAIVAAMGGSRA